MRIICILNTDRHPKPYKLSSLKKMSKVTAYTNWQKYFDNAWRDVVSMDACHSYYQACLCSMIEVLSMMGDEILIR